jgi:glycosyltransferase involved in cell wall biosynthesis
VDSGSSDDTLKIAKSFGAKVINQPWQGFSHAHNIGAQKASGDWLFFIDADERISSELRESIISILTEPLHEAYQVSRKNFIMGKALDHGGWYPDLVTRLVKKESLISWVGELHEYPKVNGIIGKLTGDLYHLTHRDIDWMLNKTRAYTYITAQILYKNNHPQVKVRNFFGAMAREFYFRAIKQRGYKDGFIGWLEIFYQTFNAFLIQVQLWQLQQSKSLETKYQQIDKEISHEF